jgi:hypothetical protein
MRKLKKRKRVQQLNSSLTGKLTLRLQKQVIQQIRQWCNELPDGDIIGFVCESALPEKQFRVWEKWLKIKESPYGWESNPELLSFYFYKHVNLELK